MGYPAPSSFVAPDPRAAWWAYRRDDGRTDYCEARGGTVVATLQRAFGLVPTGAWDDALAGAVAGRMRALDAGLAAQLDADRAARRVSPLGLQAGLFFAIYQRYGLRLDAIWVPPGTTLPAWGVAAPGGLLEGIVCRDPARDAVVMPEDPDYAAAVERSTPGIRLAPGEPYPTPPAAPPAGPAGLSNTALAVTAMVLAAGVALGALAIARRDRGRS